MRFAVNEPIVIRDDLSELRFQLESDNPEPHATQLEVESSEDATYELRQDGEPPQRFILVRGWPSTLEVAVAGRRGSGRITLTRIGG